MHILIFSIKKQIITWTNPCRVVVENSKGHLYARFDVDSEWDGLNKTAVFQRGLDEPVKVPILEDLVQIPPEVLVAGDLYVGLVGLGADGEIRIPTAGMAKPINLIASTPVTGKGPEAIAPELWERALAAIGNLPDLETEDKSSIVAAINEVLSVAKAGGGSGGSGTDGREVELSVVNGYIAWRYTGETKWRNLIAISDLTGPAGYSPVLGKDYWTPAEQKEVSDAVGAAKTAANNASEAADAANTEAQNANTAAGKANTAASSAQTAAGSANTAASNANTAAGNADAAAALANQKANAAGTAANAANAAASSANTAAGNANTAASNAQNAADEIRRAREAGEFDGEDGYTPVKDKDYFDGEDGVSPVITVTPISGGHQVTIKDANGTKTFDVMNGEDGEGAGDMTSDVYDPQGKKQDVFQYVDDAVSNIPTPDVSGQISTHNTSTGAHNDIRLLITELTNRLNALANSEDVDLDQMAELVAYIKDNRELIEQITTNKVSVSDIINNLTTNVSNKPLSAAQGVALKALVDAAATAASNAQSAADNAANKAISSMSYNTSTNQWTITYTDGTSATVTGPTIPSTNVAFGQGYATCSTTAATTAKTASLSGYVLKTGGVVAVKFTNAVPASATLNINNTGAKHIYHHSTYLKAGVINAGDVATFMYNGSTYTLLAVDRGGSWNDLTGKPASFTPTAHSHAATDVTSGVFDEARIPSLAASKITSGTFDAARIPSLAASKISAGTFAGQVVANSSGQDAATSLLRNSKLVSSETDPTVNGEINWVCG